ncbi:Histone acetyltransferase type B catalytic subunit [Talaromyces atroroseus]|uniref:Histone acetyltransferase type B catalytic subunit n=1 Tax=Talaromyces atroroseus TaxID=1441469 RepID=A0A225B2I2_TALAT|nr:Histone acetyltransferase type B catalytic subunit [Talaromyces atroroseus]OKL62189.1 Histone acetyltransferase type B catalytic subunit [Talaromyces atroroseus]
MANQGDWTCDANDAVQLTLVQPGEQKPVTTDIFHPQFTYPIFGDDEQVFGYKGLIIRLRFATHDLRTHIHISYDEKFTAVGDAAAVDLNKILKEWVAESAFTKLSDYEGAIQNDTQAMSFTPPGKLIHSYKSKDRNYEIWAGSLADTAVRKLLERAQVFIPFFIEGGTPLVLDDPEWTLERWTIYFIYEKVTPPTPTASQYAFVGYSTVYRWWFYSQPREEDKGVVKNGAFPYPEELQLSTLPARLRIAQFLILPPHQGSGHGSQLYNIIHKACVADKTVVELTIEDPNEAFDVLRDSSDYHNLYQDFLKQDININPNPYPENTGKRRPRLMPTASLIPTQKLTEMRAKYKVAPTQFAHILEMYLLSRIPHRKRASGGANMASLLIKKHNANDEDDRRYYWWRMLVKQRLYKRSRDILIQLDLPDRIQKLDETVTNVEEGYEALLTVFDAREKGRATSVPATSDSTDEAMAAAATVAEGATTMRAKRKYAIEDEDDEDEDDENEEDRSARTEAAKRPKV